MADKKIKQDNFLKRLSVRRYKKMRSHINELQSFFDESIGALKNMIEAGIEEERLRNRKEDRGK